MKVVCLLVSAVFVASFSAGCSGSSPNPTSPSSAGNSLDLMASQLPGTWELVSIQPAGEAEQASLGMVITTGTIGEDAIERAKQYNEEKGIPIELVDGEQFAKLIVEHGIRSA
jgi:hypothetical protein